MAYENIQWQLPVQAQQARSARFADMIGNVIQQKQFAEQMDLRRRQLDQPEPFNLKKTAEIALMKRNKDMPLSEQEEAAITSMSQIAPPSYGVGEFGQVVARPSGWSTMMGQSPAATGGQGIPSGTPATTGEPQDIPPIRSEQLQQGVPEGAQPRPDAPMMPSDFDRMHQGDTQGMASPPAFKVTGEAAGTPYGAKQEVESGRELFDYAAKKGIDLQNLPKEKKIELSFEMEKARREKQFSEQKTEPERKAEAEIYAEDANRAISMLTDKDTGLERILPETGLVGSWLSNIGGTEAAQIKSAVDTVKASGGLSKLDNLRQASPTGASGLGALNESEMKILQDVRGNLSLNQKKEDLVYNLQRAHDIQMNLIHGKPDHIRKVAEEKNSPPEMAQRLSFRYNAMPPQSRSFTSEDQALSAGLPKGTEVLINGRRAKIK